MHVRHKLLLGAAALVLPAIANAATIVPVTPPEGAAAAIVFGINNDNVIAGSYFDSAGVGHGFTGPLNAPTPPSISAAPVRAQSHARSMTTAISLALPPIPPSPWARNSCAQPTAR